MKKDPPPTALLLSTSTSARTQYVLLTLKCLFFKKLVAFYTAIQSS